MNTRYYMEFVGGLGDAILRLYFSGQSWYGALDGLGPDERATVALMCHNSNLREVFEWHPKKDQIEVKDFGFNKGIHPWENSDWRVANGLPKDAPCPPYTPSKTLRFYPSPEDTELLDWLRGERFLVVGATAGTPDRTVPEKIRYDAARLALREGYRLVVVGRSRYFDDGRTGDLDRLRSEDIVDAVDWLSVPGMIEAVKLSSGVVAAHSATTLAAWCERRPVFLLYNDWTRRTLIPNGPVGYTVGIDRPDGDHMEFSEYTPDRFLRWLGRIS